jgi:hypothetical protein
MSDTVLLFSPAQTLGKSVKGKPSTIAGIEANCPRKENIRQPRFAGLPVFCKNMVLWADPVCVENEDWK